MDEKVHISSLVVQLNPERIEALSERCEAFEQVEVYATDPRGKMVLVLESSGRNQIVRFTDWLQQEPGVLSVSMVYHHVENARDLDKEMDGEVGYEADAT